MRERENGRQESSLKSGLALKDTSPLVIVREKGKPSFVNRTGRLRIDLLARLSAYQHLSKAVVLLLVGFFSFLGSAWLVFRAPTDLVRYQCYALTFWFGSSANAGPAAACSSLGVPTSQPAFHVLPLEYPPLALLPFSLPLLAPLPYYALTFALLMLFIVGFMYWLLVRFRSQRAAICFFVYLVLGANVLFQVRFDLLPATCMLICLIAAERKRWNIAYSALALGVLFKLYPLIALPALFLAEQQASGRLRFAFSLRASPDEPRWRRLRRHGPGWQWKHVTLFASIVVGVMACFALLNPQGALIGPISYYSQRPTQIESLTSSLLWLGQFLGIPAQMIFSYGSLNILSPLTGPVSWIGLSLCLLGCFSIFRLQWKGQLPLGQAMIALLCLLITTGKVFSPQYLIWLIPLVAYVGASRLWLGFWLVACVLTSSIYDFYYVHLTNQATAAQTIQTLPGFFEVVILHNVVFLLLTLAYLFNWFHVRQARAPDQRVVAASAPLATESRRDGAVRLLSHSFHKK